MQYNWGYPAALKNALDYLYQSWNGKPAMIVSYGSHGGGKGAAQLKQVRVLLLCSKALLQTGFRQQHTLAAVQNGSLSCNTTPTECAGAARAQDECGAHHARAHAHQAAPAGGRDPVPSTA